MSFEAPLQLAWLALVVPVVLLYLRYLGRKAEEASTLAIWKHALAQRSVWSRWRRIVSILAACVPVVLVALALARPELTVAKTAPRSIVLIIDNTASMNATDVRPSRLGQAKGEAHRLIGRLRTHETMAILSSDSFTHAHCGLTDDHRVLQAALGQVQPTDGAGDLSLAIATAQQMLDGQANPVVVVLSDRVDDSLRESSIFKNIVLKQFGRPTSNVAITGLASRPLPTGDGAHEVFLEIANFSETAANVTASIDVSGGGASQTLALKIPAGDRVRRFVPLQAKSGGLLTATLDVDDALVADNSAQLVIVSSNPQPVSFAAATANSPTAHALASLPGVKVVSDGEASVTVFEANSPAKIPPRPTLVLGPTADSDAWKVIGELESPHASTQSDHPLVAGVDLRRVAIDRAAKLKLGEDAQIMAATAAGDPLLAIVPRPAGDIIVLAFATHDSDLSLRGDFPRLIANAIGALQGTSASDGIEWTTRDMLVDDVAAGQLVSPFGEAAHREADRPLAAPLVHAGVWQLTAASEAAALPVNLASNSESDLRAATASDLRSRVPAPLLPDIGPLWRWLVGLAVVWLLGQWVFYQRRDID